MKFLVRWAFRLLILLLVLLIGLVLVKDALIKSYTESQLQRQTGMEVRIGKMEVGLFSPTVTVQNLRIFNTAEFGGSAFLDMPELHLQYDRAWASVGKVRLKLLRLDLAQLNLVRNAAGRTNLVGVLLELQRRGIRLDPGSPDSRSSDSFGGIETLNLSLGKVTFTDLRPPALTREFRLDVRNEVVTNVKSELDVLGVIARILIRRGITIIEWPVEAAPAAGPSRPPARPASPGRR